MPVRPEYPNILVSIENQDELLRAVQALPRTIEFAAEPSGNFYRGLLFQTGVAWAFYCATPWRWFQ